MIGYRHSGHSFAAPCYRCVQSTGLPSGPRLGRVGAARLDRLRLGYGLPRAAQTYTSLVRDTRSSLKACQSVGYGEALAQGNAS